MSATSYSARSKIDALNQLMVKFKVLTQDTPPPEQGGDPGVIITGLNITWYSNFQSGGVTSFLQNPNENSEFTNRLAILSATDFVYYAIDCISNFRGTILYGVGFIHNLG